VKGDKLKSIYAFIDASNVWAAQKIKGKFFDFEKLKKFIKEKYTANSVEVFYYDEKGNMDVEMTIDAVHHKNKYDTALIFSGDSDFLALVNYLKTDGKKIYIYSSKNNISEELRTGGDGYIDVLKIQEDIWGRELKYRSEK